MSNLHIQKRSSGFTLLELLVTLSITGILLAIAAPTFSNMLMQSKIRTILNEWQTSYYFAQSEAMRLKDRVCFCASKDGQTCSLSGDFNAGWIVSHNNKGVNNILQDVAALDAHNLNITLSGNTKLANNANIVFDASGRIASGFMGTTVTAKNQNNLRSSSVTLKLIISSTGRIRSVRN